MASGLVITPRTDDVGAVVVGTSSGSHAYTVKSAGAPSGPISIMILGLAGPTDFTYTDGCFGVSLPANGTCTITVSFKPTTTGLRFGSFFVTDGSAGCANEAAIAGTGTL